MFALYKPGGKPVTKRYVCYHINLKINKLKVWKTERIHKTIYLFELLM